MVEPKHQKDGTWKFGYARPGVNYEAVVAANGESVTITQTRLSAVMTLHGLHRLHGYGGGWFYLLWAFVYDLASAALIVFSVSGVYLWHQSTTQRWLGWICLAVSFLFSGTMMMYLIYIP